MLFNAEGDTFSDFVRGRRLAQAHRALTNLRFAHRRISDIVFDSGFSDLSYFNRTFRRIYGASPSEVRATAQRDRI
jgi:AraC-like DNA-binding protein